MRQGERVDREYAVGSGRVDLCVRWPTPAGGEERLPIEVKVWRDRKADPLLIFDLRSTAAPLPERCATEQVEHGGCRIAVWRL